ncbi:hypothetical protein CWE12_12470 [Aliidiomarina sedimenti]|uniref:TVP38/TMEM64 family membrane protein n=1 Tax=Aliidiomarina sedimenti TaxID=1933879 RepID=A0ABY0BUZ2_9GAMM|nr:VTT domain-containing protein [Aliidiomarina sedimenti]RUO28036.1 hypothetical protein CWE12_12470 [Aliidiomarina sedimenti]
MQKTSFRSAKISPAKLARWQLVVGLIAVVAIIALAFNVSSQQWQVLLQSLLTDQGWAASLTLIGIYSLAVIVLLPLSPFAVTAGLLFGFWQGALIALIALNTGALLSFLISRHLLGHSLRHLLRRGSSSTSFRAGSMRLLTSNNIRVITLLRMNPLVPFNLHNYLYGAATTDLRRYVWGTLFGSAPFTLVMVYFGVTGRVIYSAGASFGPWQYTMVGLGIVLLLVLLALTKYASSASHLSDSDDSKDSRDLGD